MREEDPQLRCLNKIVMSGVCIYHAAGFDYYELMGMRIAVQRGSLTRADYNIICEWQS